MEVLDIFTPGTRTNASRRGLLWQHRQRQASEQVEARIDIPGHIITDYVELSSDTGSMEEVRRFFMAGAWPDPRSTVFISEQEQAEMAEDLENMHPEEW